MVFKFFLNRLKGLRAENVTSAMQFVKAQGDNVKTLILSYTNEILFDLKLVVQQQKDLV